MKCVLAIRLRADGTSSERIVKRNAFRRAPTAGLALRVKDDSDPCGFRYARVWPRYEDVRYVPSVDRQRHARLESPRIRDRLWRLPDALQSSGVVAFLGSAVVVDEVEVGVAVCGGSPVDLVRSG